MDAGPHYPKIPLTEGKSSAAEVSENSSFELMDGGPPHYPKIPLTEGKSSAAKVWENSIFALMDAGPHYPKIPLTEGKSSAAVRRKMLISCPFCVFHHANIRVRIRSSSILPETDATKAAQDMINHYVALQRDLLGAEVKSAIDADVVDVDDPEPGPTSLVDELFFVFKTAIESSLETCNLLAVCCIINEVGMFLSKDYQGRGVYNVVQNNLRESLPAYRAFAASAKNVVGTGSDGIIKWQVGSLPFSRFLVDDGKVSA